MPLNLGAIGLPGCWLRVAPDSQIHLPATTAADATFIVRTDANLIGMTLFTQIAAVGPAGPFHTTNEIGFEPY